MLSVYVDSTTDVVWVGTTDQLIAGFVTDESKRYALEMLAANDDTTMDCAYLCNHVLAPLSQSPNC